MQRSEAETCWEEKLSRRKDGREKKRMVKEIEKRAIHSILTAPENLSVNPINNNCYL